MKKYTFDDLKIGNEIVYDGARYLIERRTKKPVTQKVFVIKYVNCCYYNSTIRFIDKWDYDKICNKQNVRKQKIYIDTPKRDERGVKPHIVVLSTLILRNVKIFTRERRNSYSYSYLYSKNIFEKISGPERYYKIFKQNSIDIDDSRLRIIHKKWPHRTLINNKPPTLKDAVAYVTLYNGPMCATEIMKQTYALVGRQHCKYVDREISSFVGTQNVLKSLGKNENKKSVYTVSINGLQRAQKLSAYIGQEPAQKLGEKFKPTTV